MEMTEKTDKPYERTSLPAGGTVNTGFRGVKPVKDAQDKVTPAGVTTGSKFSKTARRQLLARPHDP